MVQKLPYKNIAGITPCPGGWLVLPARLAGVTVSAEDAFVLTKLVDVLDHRPKFEGAAINAPMGLSDEPVGPYRPCDAEARDYVGWPRVVGVPGTPSRRSLRSTSKSEIKRLEPWMTRHDLRRLRWLKEVEREIMPFHSRSFYSANPDVSFTMMNGDEPLRTSPYHEDGRLERIELVRRHLPGVDEVVTRVPPVGAAPVHMLQVAAMLFTARRAAGHAISRMPLDPTWDEEGLRLEVVR